MSDLIDCQTQQPEKVKSKRGRKSKKELLEIQTQLQAQCNNEHCCDGANENGKNYDIVFEEEKVDDIKIPRKRGRKPNGGKIISHMNVIEDQQDEKQNVILYLKCSLADLNASEEVNDNNPKAYNETNCDYSLYNYNPNAIDDTSKTNDDTNDDDETVDDDTKEIWQKLKQLEYKLHTNNITKKSDCFWDTCEFDNPPIYIPKYFLNGTYYVYGCFCSPECAAAYLMKEQIDRSTKFERYQLLNNVYSKIYKYEKNIKFASEPRYMLNKFYGNLTIQEYRALLRNERLFLIIDKPLTKIFPELHEDSDDFILNNKIIPSNSSMTNQIRGKMQRKKQLKNTILNEKFNINN